MSRNRAHLEQKELIWSSFCGVFLPAAEADDAFVLLVGEEKDIHISAFRQRKFHLFHECIDLRLAGAKARIHRELAHLKPPIEQAAAKLRRLLALGFFDHRQVEHMQPFSLYFHACAARPTYPRGTCE